MYSQWSYLTCGRCVQLLWSTDYENPTAWADFMNKLKEGILSAFDSALTQREEEVRRSEGQRQMPGWNFCTFFVLKVIMMFQITYCSFLEFDFRKALPSPSRV